MADNIFFSVVIPTYNRANLIAKTIHSVLNQSYAEFEVLIVDDGSTDNTEEVVKSIPDSRLFYFKKQNAERGAARNFGTKHSKGKYINFLDSDDVLYNDHLNKAFHFLKQFNYPELLYQSYDIQNPDGLVIRRQEKIKGDISEKLIYGNLLSCNGVVIRADIARQFSFREERGLSGSEDWELWLRLSSHFTFHYSNEITSSVVYHDERSVLQADESKLRSRKELSLKHAFNDTVVKRKYSNLFPSIESYFDLYISLHLTLAGNKKRAMSYLRSAFFLNPTIIFSRRFYAILKHLIF
jgi:glycosyltransferase involved in cell wall biosynthesis